ncbi:MAG: hypothetical protein A4E40_00125 [Methanoregulaceae archaeon PtaU1.Bin059]|nr:MAG: hypothetical protein A4E39_00975 [Methanoregulaceae archaeon PtaB.Bin152]OPY43462.1 MAG: hypothetical protein A4E40_00125 [Methanoregulaceae archaeon PtaU1.Bin059]
MTSRSERTGPLVAAILIVCAAPVAASYAGDRPLQGVFSDTLSGSFYFTLGDGGYSGTLTPGSGYVASFQKELPPGAEARFERIYVYWTWSRIDQAASYPTMEARLGGPDGPLLERAARYADSKGFASKNDYFSGMDSYLLPGHSGDRVTVIVNNTADDGSTFIVQGTSLLNVYEDGGAPESSIWVAEGADLLYRSYGIPKELATTRVEFPGRVDLPRVKSARLLLVAPSAGFAREEIPEMNQLLLNTPGSGSLPPLVEPVLRVLFPHYQGKTWTDVFTADESRQIGIASREIRPFLRYSDNFIEVRDNGDYFQLCNAVLRVEYREEA